MKPTLLVLAAGLGSRYGSLKQVDSFGPSGEAIIEYSVYDALKAGFGKVIFVIAKNMEKDFGEVFARKFPSTIPVDFVIQDLSFIPAGFSIPAERIKPWGTGHAVMMARNKIMEPFAVINGDDFYGRISYQKVGQFLSQVNPSQPAFCLAGYPLENTLSKFGTVSRGVCTTDEKHLLTSIKELTKIGYSSSGDIGNFNEDGSFLPLSGKSMVSMNLFGFTPYFFDALETYFIRFLEQNIQSIKAEYYLPYVVNELINAGKVTVEVIPTPETWFGVTYKEDKPFVINQLAELSQQGIYPVPLWK